MNRNLRVRNVVMVTVILSMLLLSVGGTMPVQAEVGGVRRPEQGDDVGS